MSSRLANISRTLTAWAAVGLITTAPAAAQYPAENVSLYSRVSLAQFNARAATDCWGYVSASGREYAIIGLGGGTGFVDITDPENPVIVGHVPRGGWDAKVYQHYVYSSTDSGPLNIIDVGDIDNGVITLVNSLSRGAHNIAVDELSGYLYLASFGMTVLDLADPVNPVEVGFWNGPTHDAQVVTYTDGPYAGRQVAFVFAGGAASLDIVDVTDKANMFLLSRRSYPGAVYTHQGWLSDDRQYLYLDDEFDELLGTTPTTRTLVWDVSDLSAPVLINEFTNGLLATDHNQYFREGFLFQANFKSGLRVWNVSDPLHPVETGFFDTYPPDNSAGFDMGAWTAYPFFPSGTVIVSDRQAGLFVLDVSAAVRGLRGDLNCDGAFNGADIDPFFLALGDPPAYLAAFPDCNINNADMNCDQAVNGADIDRFFAWLAGNIFPDCNANGIPDDCDGIGPLAIVTQPQSTLACVGDTVTLSVETSRFPLTVQWRKNGNPITGATSMWLWFNPVRLSDAGDYDVIVGDACVSLTSAIAILTVIDTAPSINTQPQSQNVCLGAPLVLSVDVTGPALTYQWRKDGRNITGATDPTFIVPAVSQSDGGVYVVAVANSCGTVLSDPASVTIQTTILTHPAGQTVCENDPVFFTVGATGASLTYQWRKDGVKISGASQNFFIINAAVMSDAGIYDVVVTSSQCMQTSDPAPLVVQQCP